MMNIKRHYGFIVSAFNTLPTKIRNYFIFTFSKSFDGSFYVAFLAV